MDVLRLVLPYADFGDPLRVRAGRFPRLGASDTLRKLKTLFPAHDGDPYWRAIDEGVSVRGFVRFVEALGQRLR